MTQRTITAKCDSDLRTMSSVLHDSWIETPEEFICTTPRSVLLRGRLEFGGTRVLRRWGPFVRVEELRPHLELIVRDVLAVSIEDRAQIDEMNIANMSFDQASKVMTLEGHIPVVVKLQLKSLDVTARVSEDDIQRRERWRCRHPARVLVDSRTAT